MGLEPCVEGGEDSDIEENHNEPKALNKATGVCSWRLSDSGVDKEGGDDDSESGLGEVVAWLEQDDRDDDALLAALFFRMAFGRRLVGWIAISSKV